MTTDLNPDPEDMGEISKKSKMLETHRKSYNVPESKDLDGVMRILMVQMDELSLEPPIFID